MIDPPVFSLAREPPHIDESGEQKILVLEPDIIVNDLDTLEKDDNLLVTTRYKLVYIQEHFDFQGQVHMFGEEEPIDEENPELIQQNF